MDHMGDSPQEWLSAAVRAGAIDRKVPAGQVLFRAGDRTVGLYEVLIGKLRLVRHDRNGREAILQSASAGDTLAEASLYASTYHCDAIATTDALVRLYPKALLLAGLKRDPKLAQSFTAMLAQQVMGLRTRLERRNIHSARDRIRHFLAVNASADGRTVVLSGTLKDLAADLGLTHEALYRTLARMAADGEIKRVGTTIRLTRAL
jgi:CRP/FNR family transcriptional regulator, dissimilatory nitrate respiration regulator